MRKFRQLSNNLMRELWGTAVKRRRETGSAALRESTREEWLKHKRRLGAIGRDRKGKLMPNLESVRRLPLHTPPHPTPAGTMDTCVASHRSKRRPANPQWLCYTCPRRHQAPGERRRRWRGGGNKQAAARRHTTRTA